MTGLVPGEHTNSRLSIRIYRGGSSQARINQKPSRQCCLGALNSPSLSLIQSRASLRPLFCHSLHFPPESKATWKTREKRLQQVISCKKRQRLEESRPAETMLHAHLFAGHTWHVFIVRVSMLRFNNPDMLSEEQLQCILAWWTFYHKSEGRIHSDPMTAIERKSESGCLFRLLSACLSCLKTLQSNLRVGPKKSGACLWMPGPNSCTTLHNTRTFRFYSVCISVWIKVVDSAMSTRLWRSF